MSVRREEIVDIAKRLFAANGYTATSMREIADACGVLSGSLYSHFRSKAQILELAILPFYARLLPEQEVVMQSSGSGAERFEDMLRRALAVCAQHRTEVTILHYDWPHIRDVDDLSSLIEQSNRSLDMWAEVIAGGVGDGTLRPALDPEITMRVVTSAMSGVLDRQRYGDRPDLVAERSLDVVSGELVALLLGGMGTGRARARTRTSS